MSFATTVAISLLWHVQPGDAGVSSNEDPSVTIVLDTDRTGALKGVFAERLMIEARQAVADAGMTERPASRATITIRVGLREKSKAAFDYEVISTWDGSPIDGARSSDVCERCVPDDVVAKIDAQLPAQLEKIATMVRSERASSPEEPPPRATATPAAATPPPNRADDEKARLGALGKAGIGVMGAGLGVVAIGLGLALAPASFDVDPDRPLETSRRSLRVPGIAIASVGAAAIVAGIPMLVIDRKRAKRRRVTWGPTMAPGFAGIEFAGRF